MRPALVLQKFEDGDLILCRITSKFYSTEYDVTINNWENYGLLLPSTVRVHKVMTVESTLIDQKLDALPAELIERVVSAFSKIVPQKSK